MTLRYSHLSPAHRRETVGIMDRIVTEKSGHILVTEGKIANLKPAG
jgi:hypothetical protein